jgi:hypothetical protein
MNPTRTSNLTPLKRFRLLTPALLLVLAASLPAAEPRFGVQGALAIPSGDLANAANLGLQFGGHAAWDFGLGHGLMARADVTLHTKKDDATVNVLGLGADYTYHIDQRQTGPYVLAGLSFQSFHTATPWGSANDNGLGLDFGGGYDVDRNLGLQLRLTSTSVDRSTLTSLNLGVTYRF